MESGKTDNKLSCVFSLSSKAATAPALPHFCDKEFERVEPQ